MIWQTECSSLDGCLSIAGSMQGVTSRLLGTQFHRSEELRRRTLTKIGWLAARLYLPPALSSPRTWNITRTPWRHNLDSFTLNNPTPQCHLLRRRNSTLVLFRYYTLIEQVYSFWGNNITNICKELTLKTMDKLQYLMIFHSCLPSHKRKQCHHWSSHCGATQINQNRLYE